MQVAVVLVAIPVNLCVQHVVHRLMFVALAITIHRLHIVVLQAVHQFAILATDLLALRNAGMTAAANVIAEKLATKTSLFCNT